MYFLLLLTALGWLSMLSSVVDTVSRISFGMLRSIGYLYTTNLELP